MPSEPINAPTTSPSGEAPARSSADAQEAAAAFLRAAFHELNQPLTVLRGELELALRLNDGHIEPLRAQVEAAMEEADRLILLTRALRDLAEIPSNPALFPIFMRPLLAGLIEEIADLAQLRQAGFRLVAHADMRVQADPESLRRALEHILIWMARHSRAGSEIIIDIPSPEAPDRLRLRATLEGVPDTAQQSLFEAFPKQPRHTRLAAEERLRLAAAAQLIGAMGGEVLAMIDGECWVFHIRLAR